MGTTSSRETAILLIKESALTNIEKLFTYWNLQWTKVNNIEYDFINPLRQDKHFGAVRFNTEKGIGADFSNSMFKDDDIKSFGEGFDREDFGLSKNTKIAYGFDIIGLCQRIKGLSSYNQAAVQIIKDLDAISKDPEFIKVSVENYKKRIEKNAEDAKRKIVYSNVMLSHAKPYKGTIGEKYLLNRGIDLKEQEPDVRFHHAVMCKEANAPFPALLFVIRNQPHKEATGVHRIYLSRDGETKAPVKIQKMALGDMKGNAIWFGTLGPKLYICEGPENALTLRYLGADFVACAINAGNIHNLSIPKGVKEVIVCPDLDNAGMIAGQKSQITYKSYSVSIQFPTKKLLKNGKYADINDLITGKE